jgi:hypothetical protein
MVRANGGQESAGNPNRFRDVARHAWEILGRVSVYKQYPLMGVSPQRYEELLAESNAERAVNDAVAEDLHNMDQQGVDTLHTESAADMGARLLQWEQDLDNRGLM